MIAKGSTSATSIYAPNWAKIVYFRDNRLITGYIGVGFD